MKGTMDAKLPDAENQLLNDPKELAEHYTITDLLRNDLSRVSEFVNVKEFRYIDKIKHQMAICFRQVLLYGEFVRQTGTKT